MRPLASMSARYSRRHRERWTLVRRSTVGATRGQNSQPAPSHTGQLTDATVWSVLRLSVVRAEVLRRLPVRAGTAAVHPRGVGLARAQLPDALPRRLHATH